MIGPYVRGSEALQGGVRWGGGGGGGGGGVSLQEVRVGRGL